MISSRCSVVTVLFTWIVALFRFVLLFLVPQHESNLEYTRRHKGSLSVFFVNAPQNNCPWRLSVLDEKLWKAFWQMVQFLDIQFVNWIEIVVFFKWLVGENLFASRWNIARNNERRIDKKSCKNEIKGSLRLSVVACWNWPLFCRNSIRHYSVFGLDRAIFPTSPDFSQKWTRWNF